MKLLLFETGHWSFLSFCADAMVVILLEFQVREKNLFCFSKSTPNLFMARDILWHLPICARRCSSELFWYRFNYSLQPRVSLQSKRSTYSIFLWSALRSKRIFPPTSTQTLVSVVIEFSRPGGGGRFVLIKFLHVFHTLLPYLQPL